MITARTIMSSSIVPSNNASVPNISRSHIVPRSKPLKLTWPVITICCGSLLGVVPILAVRAIQKPTSTVPLELEQENQDDKKMNSKGSNGRGGPISNIFSVAKWFLSSLLMVFPFYKNFLMIEDRIEKTATTVLHVVEEAAEVVDKVAEDVGKSLPEDSSLKKFVKTVEQIAEEVDKDAEVLESFIEKVDDMVDKFDDMLEPIIEDKLALDNDKKAKETN